LQRADDTTVAVESECATSARAPKLSICAFADRFGYYQ
jgi:hypothetical protein